MKRFRVIETITTRQWRYVRAVDEEQAVEMLEQIGPEVDGPGTKFIDDDVDTDWRSLTEVSDEAAI